MLKPCFFHLRAIEHNLRAIHKHIDAVRAQARWGVGSLAQAFAGFAALPEQASGRSYRDILGIGPDERLTVEWVDERFKKRVPVSSRHRFDPPLEDCPSKGIFSTSA